MKLARSGPSAAPIVLNKVAIPALFIRSPTAACTLVAMHGKRIPESNATGNIRPIESNAIRNQLRSNTATDVGTSPVGKNQYDSNTRIAASNRRIDSKRSTCNGSLYMRLARKLPSPIPASTTASIRAKAVGDDATYSRRNRNQITSRASKRQPVPKLTKSKRQGGRYLTSRQRGNSRCKTRVEP